MSIKRFSVGTLVLVCAMVCADAVANNESIHVSPDQPTAADPIRLDLGFLVRSNCFFPAQTTATVSGNRVDLVTDLALTVNVIACSGMPWSFEQHVDLAPLPEGQYQVVWRYTGLSADEYQPYGQMLVVRPAPVGGIGPSVALPALSTLWLLGLGGLLVMVAAFSRRLRR